MTAHVDRVAFRRSVLVHLGAVIAALEVPTPASFEGSLSEGYDHRERWRKAALTSDSNFYLWWYAVFPSQATLTAWGLPAPLSAEEPAWLVRVGIARRMATVLYQAIVLFRRPSATLPPPSSLLSFALEGEF